MPSTDAPSFPAEYIWTPPPKLVEQANVTRFMAAHGISDYRQLIARAAAEPAWVWPAALEDLGVEWIVPFGGVLDISRGGDWARGFVGDKLKIPHNCLDGH